MVLSRPPWPVFLINFSMNRRGNLLRDAGGHPEYIARFK